jgi:hypothetical protein
MDVATEKRTYFQNGTKVHFDVQRHLADRVVIVHPQRAGCNLYMKIYGLEKWQL